MPVRLSSELKRLIPSTISFSLLALIINFFVWKYRLVSGGFPGYGLLINYLTNISVGTILFAVNSLIFILAFLISGKKTGFRAIYGYIYFSFIIDFSRKVFQIQQVPIDNELFSFLILTVQGFFAGHLISLIISKGYSGGGFGTLYFVVKKYLNIKPQTFFLYLDLSLAVIVSLQFEVTSGVFLLFNALTFNLGYKNMNRVLKKINILGV